jgi:hypothetical protein
MNSRLTQCLRALIRPAPMIGLVIVAIFWLGLVYVLPADHESLLDYEQRRLLYSLAASIVTSP